MPVIPHSQEVDDVEPMVANVDGEAVKQDGVLTSENIVGVERA